MTRPGLLFAACTIFVAGCGGTMTSPSAQSNSQPSQTQVPPALGANSRPITNWLADATVTSRSGTGGCGWGTAVGEMRARVEWHVAINNGAISLDEDTPNWPTDDLPYVGTQTGTSFTAAYSQGPTYAQYVCQFREAAIAGAFSPDSQTFVADETLVWGTPGSETVVQRHWTGTAR